MESFLIWIRGFPLSVGEGILPMALCTSLARGSSALKEGPCGRHTNHNIDDYVTVQKSVFLSLFSVQQAPESTTRLRHFALSFPSSIFRILS
ncbi:hypothetical protein BKA83DRAFT_4340557, partial [Pisolithus microcarpus]